MKIMRNKSNSLLRRKLGETARSQKFFKLIAELTVIFSLTTSLALSHELSEEAVESFQQQQVSNDPGFLTHVDAFEPNYFTFVFPSGGDLDDIEHIEFVVSMLYPFWQSSLYNKDDKSNEWWRPDRVGFVYTGQYDFYLLGDEYSSAPVISRKQNPGGIIEWFIGKENSGRLHDRFLLSYFHESNGQTLGPDDDGGRTEFDDELASFNGALERVLDTTSRGWDYASVAYERTRPILGEGGSYNFKVEYRHYLDDGIFQGSIEDEIFWDDDMNVSIRDFDGLRFHAQITTPEKWKKYFGQLRARVDLKTGTRDFEGLSNISYKVTLAKRLGEVWAQASYFDGYGKELSSYHLKASYFGLGLQWQF